MISKKETLQKICLDYKHVENYQIAVNSNKKYVMHHRKETDSGVEIPSEVLKKQNLYFNRPANEFIFLSVTEHNRLHSYARVHRNKNGTGKKYNIPSRKFQRDIKNKINVSNYVDNYYYNKADYYCDTVATLLHAIFTPIPTGRNYRLSAC